jgi:hypothetical protein
VSDKSRHSPVLPDLPPTFQGALEQVLAESALSKHLLLIPTLGGACHNTPPGPCLGDKLGCLSHPKRGVPWWRTSCDAPCTDQGEAMHSLRGPQPCFDHNQSLLAPFRCSTSAVVHYQQHHPAGAVCRCTPTCTKGPEHKAHSALSSPAKQNHAPAVSRTTFCRLGAVSSLPCAGTTACMVGWVLCVKSVLNKSDDVRVVEQGSHTQGQCVRHAGVPCSLPTCMHARATLCSDGHNTPPKNKMQHMAVHKIRPAQSRSSGSRWSNSSCRTAPGHPHRPPLPWLAALNLWGLQELCHMQSHPGTRGEGALTPHNTGVQQPPDMSVISCQSQPKQEPTPRPECVLVILTR